MSKPKYPCGVCKKRARNSAVFCKGKCESWYHNKCTNLSDMEYRQISNGEINWRSATCNKSGNSLSIEVVNDKLINLNLQEDDLKKSLTIAAEARNFILEENEKLKQNIHNLKLLESSEQLELEDKIEDLEEELQNINE